MRLRFLSSNARKIAEVQAILGDAVEVVPVERRLAEVQSDDVEALVRDKCIRAFRLIGRPVFVEHTGLAISAMNGFPGGLTRIFWETVQAERVAQLFGRGEDTRAIARTRIGYCDGRRVHQFEGEIGGTIAPEPRGEADGQWDAIFVPEGESETFAEMGARKNEISMRRRALESFLAFLRDSEPGGFSAGLAR